MMYAHLSLSIKELLAARITRDSFGCIYVGLHAVAVSLPPVANVMKLFIVVIYHHSEVKLSFGDRELHYLVNYCGMPVNYQRKRFYNIDPWWQT